MTSFDRYMLPRMLLIGLLTALLYWRMESLGIPKYLQMWIGLVFLLITSWLVYGRRKLEMPRWTLANVAALAIGFAGLLALTYDSWLRSNTLALSGTPWSTIGIVLLLFAGALAVLQSWIEYKKNLRQAKNSQQSKNETRSGSGGVI